MEPFRFSLQEESCTVDRDIAYVANMLGVSPDVFSAQDYKGRTRRTHQGPAGPKLRNRTNFRTYCERWLYSEGFSLKFRRELRGGGYFDGEYWP